MSATLALPAAKLALNLAGSALEGVKNLLDPAKTKAKKQADDFEQVFLEQVTERLFATPEGTEGPLGENGTGGGIFKSQLTQQYAKHLQRAGGIGLSDQILRDLLRVQEQSGAAAQTAAVTQATVTAGSANVRR
jgi:Rod binding domain-containing protein